MRHADGRLPSVVGEYNEVTSVATIVEDRRGSTTSAGCLGGGGCQFISEGGYGQIWFEMDH